MTRVISSTGVLTPANTRFRRAMDLALAVPVRVAVSPLIGVLAVAVKLHRRGPAFYMLKRVGKDRRLFRLVKLRTMVVDAERKGAHVTASGDARVTRCGKCLRWTKLDELPQLWNVVRGDMSLVGPRPEAERYAARYKPEWEPLLSVRPGVTDPACIIFRDELEVLGRATADKERAYEEVLMPVKARLSLDALATATPAGDLWILVKTVLAVLRVIDTSRHPVRVEVEERMRTFTACPCSTASTHAVR